MKVEVEDPQAIIGQYIRHTDNHRIYLVQDVGKQGVTCDEVEGMFLPSLKGPETLITWPAFARFYRILVQATDIDGFQG
jgi:hypothetical protein